MMEPQSFHPLDYLAVVNRRKWWFVVPLLLTLALGAAVVVVWPETYLSKAAIGVQSPTLSADLLRGVSSMDTTERQRAVQVGVGKRTAERLARQVREDPASAGGFFRG